MTRGNPLTPDDGREPSIASLREALLEKAKGNSRISRRISWLLDECIRIPGTGIRFGLDPILGLVPYGGETASAIIGTAILGEAGKKGIPVKTLARMGGNMLLNAGIGTIPVVGDLFSFWFKSNTRNYHLLNTYLDSEHGEEHPGGWWPLLLILGTVVAVFVLNVIAWLVMGGIVYALWNSLLMR